jgi:vacuolar-type H+-ATPase subunit I/STV1
MSKTKQRYKRSSTLQVESSLPKGIDLVVSLETESQARFVKFKKGTKYKRPPRQRLPITPVSSLTLIKPTVFTDALRGREEYSRLSDIGSTRQFPERIERLKLKYLQLRKEARSGKSEDNFASENEDNFASENEELDITLARLQDLLEEEDEDDYGVAKPSAYAYGTALALVSEAARLMGNRLTRASASTDDRGGIRLTWTRPEAEVRLVCAHQSDKQTYLYHEAGDEYGVEYDVSASALAHWLDWLNHV